MNFAPYVRLMWKEYRAIRLFWLCLVVLVIFIQWLTAVTIHVQDAVPQFHLALLAPRYLPWAARELPLRLKRRTALSNVCEQSRSARSNYSLASCC